MIFKPYYTFESGCAGYLFGCVGESRCAVVDPREEDVDANKERVRDLFVNWNEDLRR